MPILYLICKTCGVRFPSGITSDKKSFETISLINNSHKCPKGHIEIYEKTDYFFISWTFTNLLENELMNDRKEKAIDELKVFLSNIEKIKGITGFKISGKGNIIIGNYAEGFDIGFDISGDENIAIDNEAHGPNYGKIIEKYHYLLSELDRPNPESSKIRKLSEELKYWGPTIAKVALKILEKYSIF